MSNISFFLLIKKNNFIVFSDFIMKTLEFMERMKGFSIQTLG
jgi:hypothetical protein